MTVHHAGPTDPAAAVGASAVGGTVEVRADSGIVRLNPQDGLFLRAEHLERMQDYARDLATAVGVAAGSGVVYGYSAVLGADVVQVGTGLAMDGAGRPLRSRQAVTLPLGDLVLAPDRFWVLEVTTAPPRPFGEESTYGTICDDPCATSLLRPWLAGGVTIRLVADTMPGLDADPLPTGRRNRLASGYFERERRLGGPWLTPAAPGATVGSILQRDWSAGTDAPSGAAVPLAVLIRAGGEWLLDVWTARRDLGDPHPRRAWQARLAMRPWDVFVAQVLQFQAQLADTVGTPAQSAAARSSRLVDERVDALVDAVLSMAVRSGKVTAAAQALRELQPAGADVGTPLPDLGFGELPPAGFLVNDRPDDDDPNDLLDHFKAVFGPNVDLTVCRCSADAAVRAVEAAQHLDRIPLDQVDRHPKVAVLVPAVPADLPALYAASYGWVAFVRERALDCGIATRTEEVDVHHEFEDQQAVEEKIKTDGLPPTPRVGTVSFRAGEPDPLPVVDVATLGVPGGSVLDAVIVSTSDAARSDLMQKRAVLLLEVLEVVAGTPVVPVVSGNVQREAIVLLLRRP